MSAIRMIDRELLNLKFPLIIKDYLATVSSPVYYRSSPLYGKSYDGKYAKVSYALYMKPVTLLELINYFNRMLHIDRYHSHHFQGRGHCLVDEEAVYRDGESTLVIRINPNYYMSVRNLDSNTAEYSKVTSSIGYHQFILGKDYYDISQMVFNDNGKDNLIEVSIELVYKPTDPGTWRLADWFIDAMDISEYTSDNVIQHTDSVTSSTNNEDTEDDYNAIRRRR